MSSKMDQEIARALGWTLHDYEACKTLKSDDVDAYDEAANNDGYNWSGRDGEAWEWNPSENIEHAFELLDHLRAKIRATHTVNVSILGGGNSGEWSCALEWNAGDGPQSAIGSGFQASLSTAICYAFLRAHGVDPARFQ